LAFKPQTPGNNPEESMRQKTVVLRKPTSSSLGYCPKISLQRLKNNMEILNPEGWSSPEIRILDF
jgi:hypothetical protein